MCPEMQSQYDQATAVGTWAHALTDNLSGTKE